MNYFRKQLLTKYEVRLIAKEGRLREITELLPDFENLRKSETANLEYRKMLQTQRNLKNEVAELKAMIADLKTETDDVTPAQ